MKVLISMSTGTLMYHGSPCAGLDLQALTRGVLFLTPNYKIAREYALGRVHFTGKCVGPKSPTVYYVRCNPSRVFDLRKLRDQDVYYTIRKEHPEEELPRLDSEGFIMRHTGLPSYGNVGGLKKHLLHLGYDGMVVDEGSQGISFAVFNPSVLKIERSETVS